MTGSNPGSDAESASDPVSQLDDEQDLRTSLDDLSRLVLGEGQQGLEQMLTRVAEYAVRAIPGADGAGLTLLDGARIDTLVATAEFVREVDAIQYGIGEGPCITAAAEARTVRSGSLGADGAWPKFGPRVGDLGVHSVLSLPLNGPEGTLGAMNVYAHARDAFDERAAELGELFAVPAAISVKNAQVLAQARRLTEHLQAALEHRAVIDQAMGILMSRLGCSSDEAFGRLKAMSQDQNRKLSVVASSIVDEAVKRARSRRGDDS